MLKTGYFYTFIWAMCLSLLLTLKSPIVQASDELGDRVIRGWLEHIRLMPLDHRVRAKLDSGAKSNAIHAESIERFERDGVPMARFKLRLTHNDSKSETITFESPIVREVNIKLRNTTAVDSRLAVKLDFCMAGERHTGVFTLADRSGFNYPVLLGRDFLQNRVLIDSSQTFLHNARCS
jgi:hypothetical protein